jgi:diguanylate cyclase (GGDEF)-like protein
VCESLADREFYIRMSDTKRSLKSEKDRGVELDDHKKVKVTISIGVAQRNEKYRTPDDVIVAADKALYEAKRKGRNRVEIKEK